MDKKRKRFLSSLLALWMMFNISYDSKTEPQYEIVDDGIHFANYSRGRIFIGSKEEIEALEGITYNDILIIDDRRAENPNMRIIDSYRIIDNVNKCEVVIVMQKREELDPTNWYRSDESIILEMDAHRIAFCVGYRVDNTKDADIDNADEGKSMWEFIKTKSYGTKDHS